MDSNSGPRSDDAASPSPDPGDGEGQKAPERLPPPMFPPGTRRRHLRPSPGSIAASSNGVGGSAYDIPDEAFIAPDEPIRRQQPAPSDEVEDAEVDESAFISPDEPIVRTDPPRPPEDFEEVVGTWSGADEGVVTGIGDDPHLSEEDIVAMENFGDPHVADLFRMLDRLTDAVRAKGQGGLKTSSDMTPFELSIRAYCVGYLAGRREEP